MEMVAGAVKEALFTGLVMETVGALLVEVVPVTVMETAEEVVAPPALSVALAVRV